MILDANASLGAYAFRRLRHNTADTLLGLMDRKGIDRAVVASASAITYRNPQAGNDEVAEQVKGHADRLIPFAVLNPAYPGWRDDLKVCHERYGMKGIRLYPRWHNYTLSAPECLDLVDEASARGMILSIPVRVEDSRQQSWLIDVPDVPLDEIAGLVSARPGARFLVVNGLGVLGSPLGRKHKELPANYAIEMSRLDPLASDEFAGLIEQLGPDRLVFGTGMPFSVPESSLLKLELLRAGDEVKRKIGGENLARWLAGAGKA